MPTTPPPNQLELAWQLHQILVDLTQLQILAADAGYNQTADAANRLIYEARTTLGLVTEPASEPEFMQQASTSSYTSKQA